MLIPLIGLDRVRSFRSACVRGTGRSFSSGMYSPPSALSSALSDSDSELDSIATSGSGTGRPGP